MLAATNLAIDMLTGCLTRERRLILKLCMHVIFQLEFLQEQDIDELVKKLRDLEKICDLQEALSTACNTSFFYWSREMLQTYFGYIYEHPTEVNRLQVKTLFFVG